MNKKEGTETTGNKDIGHKDYTKKIISENTTKQGKTQSVQEKDFTAVIKKDVTNRGSTKQDHKGTRKTKTNNKGNKIHRSGNRNIQKDKRNPKKIVKQNRNKVPTNNKGAKYKTRKHRTQTEKCNARIGRNTYRKNVQNFGNTGSRSNIGSF